jgi:hypothetical protein
LPMCYPHFVNSSFALEQTNLLPCQVPHPFSDSTPAEWSTSIFSELLANASKQVNALCHESIHKLNVPTPTGSLQSSTNAFEGDPCTLSVTRNMAYKKQEIDGVVGPALSDISGRLKRKSDCITGSCSNQKVSIARSFT